MLRPAALFERCGRYAASRPLVICFEPHRLQRRRFTAHPKPLSGKAKVRTVVGVAAAIACLAGAAAPAVCDSRGIGDEMMDFGDGLDDLGGLGGGDFGGSRGVGRGPRGARVAMKQPKVPVTILCGFLGAGKTTLVRHILRNREGMKVGVVVNDIAETNIDSEILKFEDADGIVGLQNGCVCCSGRDDLFARLQELVEGSGVSKLDKPWDRLVVECSGVAEPESIASELEAMGRRGEPVMRRIFLAGIICVVDASTFWENYSSGDAGDSERRPLSELLVNQLESSDTVIISKTDLIGQEEHKRLDQLLSVLAPNTRRRIVTKGEISLRELLPADPVDLDMPAYVPTLANRHSTAVRAADKPKPPTSLTHHELSHGDGHGHGASHGSEHGHEHSHGSGGDCHICISAGLQARHARYGLSSFVYRRDASRRFDVVRLGSVVRSMPVASALIDLDCPTDGTGDSGSFGGSNSVFQGVLRSKGFIRVVGSDKVYYWSHAGRQIHLAETDGAPTMRANTAAGQEVVFIGAGIDQTAITAALDACLAPAAEPQPDASL